MFNRALLVILLIAIVLMILAIPTLAYEYRYTGTSFRYIGDVFHEKEIKFDRGNITFRVEGKGMVQGAHDVHNVKYLSPAEGVYTIGRKVNMFAQFTGYTDPNASMEERMRIFSGIDLRDQKTVLNTGIAMNPGESGHIDQSVASYRSPDGSYLKIDSHVENSGGITVRELEVGNYVSESMRVEGSAKVWESTTKSSGGVKTGWWDTGP